MTWWTNDPVAMELLAEKWHVEGYDDRRFYAEDMAAFIGADWDGFDEADIPGFASRF